MSSRKRPLKAVPQPDPAQAHNETILAERSERLMEQQTDRDQDFVSGLGLGLVPPEKPKSAMEFFRDEFDRKNFGDPLPTFTRILYGPDPLLTNCPGMKEQIEKVGLEEYAECAARAILIKRAQAFSDPFLQRAISAAIRQFGDEAVADAFRKRILSIPTRTVDIEVDRDDDDEVFGKPLDEAVRRYGNPGMRAKFLSEKCIGNLGTRGYQIVKNEHGEPVKVGTLVMGEIPEAVAQRRAMLAVRRSNEALHDQEDSYLAEQARWLNQAGAAGVGSRPLAHDETITAQASEDEARLGERLSMGVRRDYGEEKAA